MGWLHKTNFCKAKEKVIQLKVARHLANLLIKNKVCIFSQWIKGKKNEVADLLSRDHTMSDIEITNQIIAKFPTQVPKTFKTTALPKELTSKYSQLVRDWQSIQALHKAHNGDMKVTGPDGLNSLQKQEESIPTYKISNDTVESTSYRPLCTPCELKVSTPFIQMASWHQRRAESTLPAWQRPSYCAEEVTRDTIWTENFQNFYKNKVRDTKQKTQP
jgi:hypothetical protein